MSAINTLPDLLRAQASRIPDQPFVRWRGRSVSYGEFDARTDALAAGLAELGVQPGDVVSVMLPNCLEFLEAWWAILKAGAVFGPINPAFTAPEAAYVVGHSRAVAIVTDRHGAATLAVSGVFRTCTSVSPPFGNAAPKNGTANVPISTWRGGSRVASRRMRSCSSRTGRRSASAAQMRP